MPFTTGAAQEAYALGDGLLRKGGRRLFPIGFYELPREDAELERMASSGINLVCCHSREDLDRVHAAGMMGWLPLPLHEGATDALRQAVEAVKDHPALAVWEGPDEIVWTFTLWRGLEQKAGIRRSDWWEQTPKAVEYAEAEARRIVPNLREAIRLVRELDQNNHQIWINEARSSDVKFVRQYADYIDITGCDDYPIQKTMRSIARLGGCTERWRMVGRGKPVWMVLQAFSPTGLSRPPDPSPPVYPSFAESRFMAYAVIAHGASGVLYWGSEHDAVRDPNFRDSLYALTSELAALQPFLVAPEEREPKVALIEGEEEEQQTRGVKMTVRRNGREWLIALVNEDERRHMGVEVSGLESINGLRLDLLHGTETATVERGGFVTRMQPYEVKAFATGREWETAIRKGRDFH